ncbi:hypothetical protein J3D64_004673 [Priestia megaterium]|nr:hypothetical protein [Priestia megaterium]
MKFKSIIIMPPFVRALTLVSAKSHFIIRNFLKFHLIKFDILY